MFLRNDHGLYQGGGGFALPQQRPAEAPAPGRKRLLGDFEIAPDLGSRIGTLTWYRGVATCIGLCALTFLLSPGFENPIYGHVPAALEGRDWEAARAQAIAPLAQGANTGHRMAATALVAPLADTPERPIINVTTKLAGGSLLGALRRAGVGGGDADQVAALIGDAIDMSDVAAGTPLDITLGRRQDRSQPRPLEQVAFRARFDLSVRVSRENGGLRLTEIPIAVDNTPLRIQGEFGPSLYRSARAAGAPARAVEAYIRSLGARTPISRMGSGCRFDLIVEHARAETGEVRVGNLMYAGVTGCSQRTQLVRMTIDGRDEWFDASGRGERRGMMAMPVAGRITSGFGARRHPVLGYRRMHSGLDIGAPYGAPIYAATDGVVTFAGRNGGYGNFVKISHSGGLATGYGHMSRIAVRSGTRVRRGQVIGYIGSTGLSTGPHLHYELYRSGRAINPRSVAFASQRELGGRDLSELRARLNRLTAVPIGRAPSGDDEEE